MEGFWQADAAEDQHPACYPKFARDMINPASGICKAYAIDLPEQISKWKIRSFPQKLDSLLLNFVCSLAQAEPSLVKDLDFRLWLYAIDSDGFTAPTYEEYKTFWLGRRMNRFYLFLSTNVRSIEVIEAFDAILSSKRVALNDEGLLPRIPSGAVPLYRFNRAKVIEYVERVVFDPVIGKVPAFICPIIQKGWLRYAWMPVDVDRCVRQALAAGEPIGRPTETVTCNGEVTDLKVELRVWAWSSPPERQKPSRSRKPQIRSHLR